MDPIHSYTLDAANLTAGADSKLIAFWQGLRNIPWINLSRRQDYCVQQLENYQSLRLQAIHDEDPKQAQILLIVVCYVRRELSKIYRDMENFDRAMSEMSASLSEARETGYSQSIYLSIMGLGELHLDNHDYRSALESFQSALRYATIIWTYNYPHTLRRMIYALENLPDQPDQYEVILFLYDCLCRFNPLAIDDMTGRFEFLIRNGQADAVKKHTKVVTETCDSIAIAVAARLALRHRKRACTLARHGLEIARTTGDEAWSTIFGFFVNGCNK